MDEVDLIDWESSQSHMLLNPRMPLDERRTTLLGLQSLSSLVGHIWLSTSGSSGVLKFAALSKKAILTSAAAVNRHLECSTADIWIKSLPHFHIGGLAIYARSFLSGSKIVEYSNFADNWDPCIFVALIEKFKVSLASLVPTQVFDLVKNGLCSPKSLRAVVVGGGALNEVVYQKAIDLGWNILLSYGSTECSSQIATAPLDSWKEKKYPLLKPLDHVELLLDEKGGVRLRGDSLLTGYAQKMSVNWQIVDPKIDGWLITEDYVVLKNGMVEKVNREGNFIKIGGESVDLTRIDKILEEVRLVTYPNDMSIFAAPDERLGHVLHLAIADNSGEMSVDVGLILKRWHERVHPFERIKQVHFVGNIPRTALNKVIRSQLAKICLEGANKVLPQNPQRTQRGVSD